MYQVLENNCPADSSHFTSLEKGLGWDNSRFPTFLEACDYARSWLNDESIEDDMFIDGFDHNGYGDIIKVVKVKP